LHWFQQNGVNLIVTHKNSNLWFLPCKPDTLITLVNAFTHIHGVFAEMRGVFGGMLTEHKNQWSILKSEMLGSVAWPMILFSFNFLMKPR
jgi:hypothetical protein